MILRIDDYPTGIRPVQPGQMEVFQQMLGVFGDMPIHLGIVPKTFEKFPIAPVGNIIPCQHGYEHGYREYSEKLIKAKDPYNNHTIGTFDEFAGLNRSEINTRIADGKKTLEQTFGPVDTFIPCCNVLDHHLVKSLFRCGFSRILCDGDKMPPDRLPIIRSDYYGRLVEMDMTRPYQVVTLHLTWEWDFVREHGFDKWAELVGKFKKMYHRTEAAPGGIDYRILFKYPIRERKEKFFQTLDLYYQLMTGGNFQFLITIDEDDKVMNSSEVMVRLKKYKKLKVEVAGCKSKIEAVNHGIWREDWDIVVIVSDDMIPKVRGYDRIIRTKMQQTFPDTDGALWFNDGFQRDHINTLQIMGRKWYDRWGFVYHPDYISQRCDYEYQLLAKKWGRIKYFHEVLIRHEHADFGLPGTHYDKLLLHNYTFIRRDEKKFHEREAKGFPVGIPRVVHFIWNEGTPLSYLRYQTYVTWKLHNPGWVVKFHLVKGCKTEKTWKGKEQLEFTGSEVKDYLPGVDRAEIVPEYVDGILPNYASDLIRWKSLYEDGGFYLDLDQIIRGPFDYFVDHDIVWGGDRIHYSGVVGMFQRCPVADRMWKRTAFAIKTAKNYCDAGNWLWSAYVTSDEGREAMKYYKTLCTEQRVFYPVPESHLMKQYYKGKSLDAEGALSVHWFGGHPDSQEFNKKDETEIDKIIDQWQ